VNAGLEQGDILLAVNGQELRYYDQVADRMSGLKGRTVSAEFLRGDEKITKELQVNDSGKLGIWPAEHNERFGELGYFEITRREYGFFESFGAGITKFSDMVASYWDQLAAIFNPKTGAYKGVGGFKAIYDIFPGTWSWPEFWNLTAFLSIMLGVLNLLPIPALDGGHVMFLLWEIVSGKKPSDKFLEVAQMIGFFILIALVLFANGNDIIKAFSN
jgi:regulator of sigma E protease